MRNFFIFLRAANLGNRGSRDITTPVGADSISARESRGGANTPGGINPAPTNKFYVLDQPGRP